MSYPAADMAVANQAERVTAQIAPDELGALPVVPKLVAFIQEPLGPWKPTSKHDQEGERLVGNGLRILAWGSDESYSSRAHRLDVYVDRATTGAAYEAQLRRGIEHRISNRGTLHKQDLHARHAPTQLAGRPLVFLDPQFGWAGRSELGGRVDLNVVHIVVCME